MNRLRSLKSRIFSKPANIISVEFDDDSIRVIASRHEQTQSLAREKLAAIWVLTNDLGPWLEDVFWVLFEETDGGETLSKLEIPNGADNLPSLLERFHKLPGFDEEALIKAMQSTNNAVFKVWGKA